MNNWTHQLIGELSLQTEQLVLEQLGDLISKGLLIIEKGPMSLVHEHHLPGYKMRVMQQVKLVLKDREYIDKLENENKRLKEQLKDILNLKKELS